MPMSQIAEKLGSIAARRSVWIPAAVLAILTGVCWLTGSKSRSLRPFYFLGRRTPIPLAVGSGPALEVPLQLGSCPAWRLGCGGLAVWIVSFLLAETGAMARSGVVFALLLFIGPGILVNVVFKPYWNRPRPCTCWSSAIRDRSCPSGNGETGKRFSFPSGHAAMGFCRMAPAFVCCRRRPARPQRS